MLQMNGTEKSCRGAKCIIWSQLETVEVFTRNRRPIAIEMLVILNKNGLSANKTTHPDIILESTGQFKIFIIQIPIKSMTF